MHDHDDILVALVGQPNSGKSTVFNYLTGLHQTVANYPGVTVAKKSGHYHEGKRRIEVVDLPGTYSLSSYSQEERVTRDFLLLERPEVVVLVIDAANLRRHLYLAFQLRELQVPLVVCLNMMDIAQRRGFQIDIAKLETILGVPVVPTVARCNHKHSACRCNQCKNTIRSPLSPSGERVRVRGETGDGTNPHPSPLPKGEETTVALLPEGERTALIGLEGLRHQILAVAQRHDHESPPDWKINYGELEPLIAEIDAVFAQKPPLAQDFPTRWLAVKLLENDREARRIIQHHLHEPGWEELLNICLTKIENYCNVPLPQRGKMSITPGTSRGAKSPTTFHSPNGALLNAELLHDHTGFLMTWLPPYFNFRARRLYDNVLKERNKDEIDEAWRKYGITADYTKLCNLIYNEFVWCNSLFHPDDECHVLFWFWKKTWFDDLASVNLLVRVQEEFDCTIPDDILGSIFTDPKLTLRQFLEAIVALRDVTPDASCESPHPNPLPEGEGTSVVAFPEEKGMSVATLPVGEGADQRPLAPLGERVRVRGETSDSPQKIIASKRNEYAEQIEREVIFRSSRPRRRSDRLDSVLCHPIAGLFCVAAVFFLAFSLAFNLADGWEWLPWVSEEGTFTWQTPLGAIDDIFKIWIPYWLDGCFALPDDDLRSLIYDGIIAGVGGVLVFIPVIFFIFFLVAALEQSGYMARVVVVLDRLMRLFGLHGNSVLPMILAGGIAGGCAVPAVMATRTMREQRERLLTILILPLMNCGAKVNVYILLIGAFFSAYQGLMMAAIILISWTCALFAAVILGKLFVKGKVSPLLIELPAYQVPLLRDVLFTACLQSWWFIKRAGTIILVAAVIMWALMYYPKEGDSYAAQMGKFFVPVTQYAGFDWRDNVALIGGFAAKEVIVSSMITMYEIDADGNEEHVDELAVRLRTEGNWTPLKAFVILLFVMLYSPCFATCAIIWRETGHIKYMLIAILYTNVLAFGLAVAVYQVGSFFSA